MKPTRKKTASQMAAINSKRLADSFNARGLWVVSHWFSEEPAVHYCAESHLPFLASKLPRKCPPIVHFVQPMWHLDESYAIVLRKWLKTARPEDRLIYLLNDEAAVPVFHNLGLEAHFVNQNAFLDENLWHPPVKMVPILHDAVYNARMMPFKRHHLAKDIVRLALIAPAFEDETKAWEKKMLKILPDAIRYAQGREKLTPENVREVLWQSRVGLCLSEEEGAMYAAGEYGLCGLPIVSTQSRGGRDAFVNLPCNLVVPPDSTSIAAAVHELMETNTDANHVRQTTIRILYAHRSKFIGIGQGVYDSLGCGRDFGRDFYVRFLNKLGGFRPWRETVAAEFLQRVNQIK